MGKSFNDRNRKKGAERAYRKTKRSDKGKRGSWDRGDDYGSDSRKQQANQSKGDSPPSIDWV